MTEDLKVMVIIAGGVAAAPFVARKLRVPSAILEIALGMLLFGAIELQRPGWFPFFQEIGLVYLMFIAGLELDMNSLLKDLKSLLNLSMSLLAFALMPLLFMRMGYPLFLGIVVSVLSAGVAIPVLKESGHIETPLGRDVIGIALTGEFLSIVILTAIDIHHRHGFTLMGAFSAGKFIVLLALAGLFLKLLYVAAWWNPEKVEKLMESEDPVEEGIRAVIFMAFFGALLAIGAGVEPILGSFMGGLIFGSVFKSKGKFEDKINAVGFGFFVPFFFIGVGADFDPIALKSISSVLFSLFLVGAVLLSNLFPLILFFVTGKGFAKAAATSLLLSTPLSMMVVAGTIGKRAGFLDHKTFGAVVLASMVSAVLYASLFKALGGHLASGHAHGHKETGHKMK